jgi:ADP-glucose pyrophosphorylase
MTEILSIVLGGGKGTRLSPLTKERSKPAVPFGGKYRIVDIPISNCINSGFKKIYILTQFNSASSICTFPARIILTIFQKDSWRFWLPSRRLHILAGTKERLMPCAKTSSISVLINQAITLLYRAISSIAWIWLTCSESILSRHAA